MFMMCSLLGVDEAETTAYKWLRAVPPSMFTGPHYLTNKLPRQI